MVYNENKKSKHLTLWFFICLVCYFPWYEFCLQSSKCTEVVLHHKSLVWLWTSPVSQEMRHSTARWFLCSSADATPRTIVTNTALMKTLAIFREQLSHWTLLALKEKLSSIPPPAAPSVQARVVEVRQAMGPEESTGYAFCGFEFTLVVLIRLFKKLILRNTYSIHYSVQRCLFCCYIRIRPQWISNLDRCHYCSRQMKYACTAVYSVRRYLEGLPNQISQFITRVSSAPYSV